MLIDYVMPKTQPAAKPAQPPEKPELERKLELFKKIKEDEAARQKQPVLKS